jgi:WD40 repeat protein
VAGARAERMIDPELALLLASRAYRLHPDAETESALRQATADARSILTMDAHSEIHSLAVVSDSQVADADRMGTITVRDLQGRTPPITAPVQGHSFAFGPDGRLVIALLDQEPGGSRIVLWRPGDSDEVRSLAPPSGGVGLVAYSPDGRWVAATGEGSHVHVWDTTQDRPPRSLSYTGEMRDFAFGPGGRLVLGTMDGTIRIWDVGGTAPPVVIRQPSEFSPSSVAFSPDGDRIAVGGLDKVMVWPADGRTEPQIYRGPEYWYTSVAFSPDGHRIAAGTNERTIRIWNISDSTRGLALRGHQGGVHDLAFSPDGRRLVSASGDSTVRVWDTTGAADPTTVALPAAHHPAQLSGNGDFAAVSGEDGTVAVFPARTPQNVTTLRNTPPNLESLAVSADGRGVAASSPDSERIHWWRTETGGEPAVRECPHLPVPVSKAIALNDDGKALAANCVGGQLLLWRADGSQVADRIDYAGAIAISPDGTRVATIRDQAGLVLWEPAGREVRRTLKGQSGPADHVRFSQDGRLLAVAGNDGTIRVWTVATDDDPVVLTGTVGQTTAISFSPDGKRIAGVSTDDVIRLWNTDGSGEPLTFDHPAARQLVFSADGRQIITLHGTNIRFTPCEVCGPIDEVLALAGQRTTRDFTPEERARYLR